MSGHVCTLALVLLLAGCQLIGPDAQSTALVFRTTIGDARCTRSLGRGDFEIVSDRQFDAGPFRTATSGTLRVECSVSEEDLFATEDVALPLQADRRYHVECTAGPVNPFNYCFGCSGYEARSLVSAPGFAEGDSLFVVWAGSSINNPVHY